MCAILQTQPHYCSIFVIIKLPFTTPTFFFFFLREANSDCLSVRLLPVFSLCFMSSYRPQPFIPAVLFVLLHTFICKQASIVVGAAVVADLYMS